VKFCPLCGGDVSAYLAAEGSTIVPQGSSNQSVSVQRNYDQTKTWQELIRRSQAISANPPDITQLALAATTGLKPLLEKGEVSTIVHIVFDKAIVPQGGALYQAALMDSPTQPSGTDNSEDRLRSLGYGVKDGKVEMVDEIPIGPAYGVLEYWGGDRQHRRWHLAAPVELNASRNGDLYFMDENMIAFGAKWSDGERIEEGLLELLGLFESGVGGEAHVAQPIALEIVAQPS
jgi:hypothetical protein